MAGNGGYRDVMEVAWVGHGGSQSQGGAWVRTVTRRARVIRAQGRVGSASEFGRTWLQRAGRCADSSFSSRISVTDRGLIAGCDGGKGSEEGNYECGVGSVTRR